MLITIDKVIVGDRIRKSYGDIEELAEDIKENGLINPPDSQEHCRDREGGRYV